MKHSLFILFILFVTSAQARQQVEEENWDLDLELFEGAEVKKRGRHQPNPILSEKQLKSLEEIDFKSIDGLKEYERYYERKRRDIGKKRKKFRWATKPYMALLRKDSIIYSLEDGNGHIVFRKAYIMAEEKVKGGDIIFIFDKHGKKRYWTSAINVLSIERDLDLDERPKKYSEWEKPVGFRSQDKTLKLDNYINLHYEYMTDEYLDDLFQSLLPADRRLTETFFEAYATRLEYKVFYRWNIPIEFGVNFNYQEGSWQGTAQGLIWRSVFFGPVAKYPIQIRKDYEINLQLSYQKSFFFKARSLTQNFSFNYSTNALELNLNGVFKTRIGKWVLGGTYRRARASLKDATVELSRDSDRGLMQSWSAFIGHNFELDIEI